MAPGVWPSEKKSKKIKKATGKKTLPKPSTPKMSVTSTHPVASTSTNDTKSNIPASSFTKPKRSDAVSFVGKKIKHKWSVTVDGQDTWYDGVVLKKANKMAEKHRNAKFEVKYDGEDTSSVVANLFKDYMDGSVYFVN